MDLMDQVHKCAGKADLTWTIIFKKSVSKEKLVLPKLKVIWKHEIYIIVHKNKNISL